MEREFTSVSNRGNCCRCFDLEIQGCIEGRRSKKYGRIFKVRWNGMVLVRFVEGQTEELRMDLAGSY